MSPRTALAAKKRPAACPAAAERRFAEKLRQLKTAQAQAVEIARVVNDGELRLEEASTKLAIQLIMETLVVMKQLKGRDSNRVVKVLDVLARLQTSNVLRERLKTDFRRAVEKARAALVKGVRAAVGRNKALLAQIEGLINEQAAELAK
jgi:oligoribonuclease (3'-5' exoribonuclease)